MRPYSAVVLLDEPMPDDLGVLLGQTFEFFVRRAEMESIQYSAFCQQWIAIAMAALVGRE